MLTMHENGNNELDCICIRQYEMKMDYQVER